MPTPVHCRSARPADLDELLRLEAQFPGDRISRRQMRLHARHAGGMRVLVEGTRLLGYALLLFRRRSRVARIYSLVVDAGQRGRGLGRELLADAEVLARRRGARALRLEVREDNAAARALYGAAGYREIARRAGYYEDGMDALRLEKPLAPVRAP